MTVRSKKQAKRNPLMLVLFQEVALLEMLGRLDASGIAQSGAGRNLEEAASDGEADYEATSLCLAASRSSVCSAAAMLRRVWLITSGLTEMESMPQLTSISAYSG